MTIGELEMLGIVKPLRTATESNAAAQTVVRDQGNNGLTATRIVGSQHPSVEGTRSSGLRTAGQSRTNAASQVVSPPVNAPVSARDVVLRLPNTTAQAVASKRQVQFDLTIDDEAPQTRRVKLEHVPQEPKVPKARIMPQNSVAASGGGNNDLEELDEDDLELELRRIQIEKREIAIEHQLKKRRKQFASRSESTG